MKKKKGKRLFIRKKRNLSTNKRKLWFFEEFSRIFNYFFYHKKNKKIKKSFNNFLKRFHFSGIHKIYNYTKILGFNKNYKMNIYMFKSDVSMKFLKKYKLKSKKFNSTKKKKSKMLKNLYNSMFYHNRSILQRKKKSIYLKKILCLHFSYRHLMGLPVRGQRTKTNAKTRKDFNIT